MKRKFHIPALSLRLTALLGYLLALAFDTEARTSAFVAVKSLAVKNNFENSNVIFVKFFQRNPSILKQLK